MTKNNKRLIIFFILLLGFLLPILSNVKMLCPFKKLFNISCPGCGLTRSILALFHFNIASSFYYNILGLPLVVILTITYILLIIDIIKKENHLTMFWLSLTKHYQIIIVLLIIAFILNNIHNI